MAQLPGDVRLLDCALDLLLVLWQDQIQKHRNDSTNNEWRLDNQINSLEKSLEVAVVTRIGQDLAKPGWLDDVDETDCQGHGENEAIAASPVDQSEHTNTSYCDCGIEEDLHASKD